MFFRSFSTQLYFSNVGRYPKFQQNMETYLSVRILDSMLNIIFDRTSNLFVGRTRVRLKYRKLLKIATALEIEILSDYSS